MNMIEIERALRELRLSGMAQTLPTRLMQAQAAQEPFVQTFAAMLQDELDRRRRTSGPRRTRGRWAGTSSGRCRGCGRDG